VSSGRLVWFGLAGELALELGVARLDQDGAVGEQDRREDAHPSVDADDLAGGVLVVLDVDPAVLGVKPVQDALGAVTVATPGGAVDGDLAQGNLAGLADRRAVSATSRQG
jgi:hypothetical protein